MSVTRIRKIQSANIIAIDTETTGTYLYHGCQAFMVTACNLEGEQFCWEGVVDVHTRKVSWERKDIDDMIRVFSTYDIIVYHNATFDMRALEIIDDDLHAAVSPKLVDDTIIQSHIINSASSHGLKDLGVYYLDLLVDDETELKKAVQEARSFVSSHYPDWAIAGPETPSLPNYRGSYIFCDYWLPKAVAKFMKYKADHPWHTVCEQYGLWDVIRTIVLWKKFIKYLDKHDLIHVYREHRKVIPVIKSIQDHGFHFFKAKAEDAVEKLYSEIAPYNDRIVNLLGPDFNIQSNKQVSKLLYEDYDLPVISRTKKGNPSTDAETLTELFNYCGDNKDAKEFLECVLEIAVRNTTCGYINNYIEYSISYDVEYNTGEIIECHYLHPSVNQTGTKTTRMSSSSPNAQNISKGKEDEDEDGNKRRVFNLRELFGPPPGYHWAAVDYKSLQLIIFAYESGDQGLIETFLKGGDPHNYVARTLFDVETPSDLERRIAKNVNYALIFGAGATRLDATAGKVGIKDLYKQQFPSTDAYMRKVIRESRSKGYVKTAWDYPIVVPPDMAYKGVNFIIQGDEGDLVKRAMINCHDFLSREAPECKLIMQIHDELIFEFPDWFDFPLKDIERLMMKPSADIGWVTPVDSGLITTHWGEKTCL